MNYVHERERMVREQLEGKGIRSVPVLQAFRKVPRHLFVAPGTEEFAYEDRPLGIGEGQTISQPYMVATMTEALELSGGEKVLEIGTGSGYQAAILAELGCSVYTIERIESLSMEARRKLEQAGYPNLHFRVGDGTLGWPEEAPFDRIVVTAGAPDAPVELLRQLREGGCLLIPIGGERRQDLVRFRREEGRVTRQTICACSFVKLVGTEGWPEE
ncbi:MAG: protein-L-isoaspartate(D-aspartate) O-methyltransferase [Planctomycetes bacterium]|nr:protein-L-isoaspartate(D-aspartate) O-methyltransferase [Planctomycetota bacterium]